MTDEIRFIGDLQKVTLGKDDVLVLQAETDFPPEVADRLRQQVQEAFPEYAKKVLVLCNGLKLDVVEHKP